MSLKLVVCWICLWINVTIVSANYVLVKERTTWQVAKNRGYFAIPEIQLDNSSFTVETYNLQDNEEAWVGYYTKETAFAYIGCGRFTNEYFNVTLPILRYSPGFCYSICNKFDRSYIGLNKRKCFCMNEKPSGNISLPVCDISPNGTWMAGGGDEYMSIYERIETGRSEGGGKCLTFESSNNYKRTWNGCLGPYLALCKKGVHVLFPKHGDKKYYNWRSYVQACFEYNSFPITYNDIVNSTLFQATGPTWSNIIRSDVIYKYYETSNSTGHDDAIRYGYIKKDGNNTVLSFTEKSSNVKRYCLQTTVVRQTTLTSEINFTPMNRTQGFKLKTGISASESSDVGVAVSVSVVIVVLVAALVIITIILKRRGKVPSICIKSPALDKTLKRTSDIFPTKNNEYVESQETDYAQIDEPKANNNVNARPDLELSNGHYAHTYFVFEPGTRESNTDVDISDPGKDNTDINDDYNTLHETVNARTKGNDTYDTTEKAALKVKAQQTAENGQESPKMLNETEEDTYNRIDRSPLKNGKTDNIYGIPKCLENDYGDVGKSREKNVQDGDDTYNHVKLNQ